MMSGLLALWPIALVAVAAFTVGWVEGQGTLPATVVRAWLWLRYGVTVRWTPLGPIFRGRRALTEKEQARVVELGRGLTR